MKQPMTFQYLDSYCEICGKQRNTWDKRCCIATATRQEVCEDCLAEMYGKTTQAFRILMEEYFDMRPCQGMK